MTKRAPLVPEDIPANQNPIKQHARVIIFSLFDDSFQLERQNIVTP